MIATIMSRSRAEIVRGWVRWFPLTAVVAVVPKCVACLVAYAGAGAALGARLGSPELCGAAAATLNTAIAWCAALGAVIALAGAGGR